MPDDSVLEATSLPDLAHVSLCVIEEVEKRARL